MLSHILIVAEYWFPVIVLILSNMIIIIIIIAINTTVVQYKTKKYWTEERANQKVQEDKEKFEKELLQIKEELKKAKRERDIYYDTICEVYEKINHRAIK